jgi:predicted nucleotidyltransferase
MINEATIEKAVDLLKEAAKPRKIILFGSYAQDHATEESDLDFLVVEERVPDVAGEMVRLRRILSPLRIPVDVVVVSEKDLGDWSDTPGNVLYSAVTEGKVVYETA